MLACNCSDEKWHEYKILHDGATICSEVDGKCYKCPFYDAYQEGGDEYDE